MELTIKLIDLSEKDKRDISQFLERYIKKNRIYEFADYSVGSRLIKHMGCARIFSDKYGELYLKKLEAQDKLFLLAQNHEKSNPIDWGDCTQSKYYLEPKYYHGSGEGNRSEYRFSDTYERPEYVYFTGFSDEVDFKNFIEKEMTSAELNYLCAPVRFK